MYLECFALRKTGLGPDHPHTLNTMYDLAVLYDTMGEDLEKAQKMYAGCIAKCLAVLGPNEHLTLKAQKKAADLKIKIFKQMQDDC